MYAVIEAGGKQYRVSEGDILFLEKMQEDADSKITFEKVLAVGDEGKLTVGTPTVEGAEVTGTILKHGKSKKIVVFTYVPKSGQKRKMGHRQQYTKVEIDSIKG